MPGTNAPLVASQEPGGRTTDHDSYLENPGRADIFFPTNFDELVRINVAAAAAAAAALRVGTGGEIAVGATAAGATAAAVKEEGEAGLASHWRAGPEEGSHWTAGTSSAPPSQSAAAAAGGNVGGHVRRHTAGPQAAAGRGNGIVMTTRQFMEMYADCDATATASGYNPLLQDFSNTKFFLS